MKTVTEHLLALADAGNAAFTARLAPGVDPDRMLGCRIPQLRRLARTLRGTPEAAAFLTQLPHRYYDETTCTASCWDTSARPARRSTPSNASCPTSTTGRPATSRPAA